MEVVSGYEQSREKRIKENLERMQKLGIVDLSMKLKSINHTPKRPYTKKTPQSHSLTLPAFSSVPARRSSRLQNSTPVSYSEMQLSKKDDSLDDGKIMREVGSRPEVYNEEHEKLLGSTEMSWTLFVDGYGKDGKRIYDPVRGKTCHQCRQKTLGHRTNCSNCNKVQGQFCGDCLYMRYGEHVLEANNNPNWICPACRGICNCSFCRQAKGWPPTGTMYRRISSLGYKSVAHYLIQTHRASQDSDKDALAKTPVAKRSLPFSDEVTLEQGDLSKSNGELFVVNDPLPEPENVGISCENEKELKLLLDNKLDDSMKVSETLESDSDTEKTGNENLKIDPLSEPEMEKVLCENEIELKIDPLSEPEMEKVSCENEIELKFLLDNKLDDPLDNKLDELLDNKIDELLDNKLDELLDNMLDESMKVTETRQGDNNTGIKAAEIFVEMETSSKFTEESGVVVPTTPDSIGGRLRKRRNDKNNVGSISGDSKDAEDVKTPDITAGNSKQKSGNRKRNAKDASVTSGMDSIARRLKMRRGA